MIGVGTIGYSVFSRDGMYEAYDPAIVGTVALALFAYVWPNVRTLPQRVAIAAVLGGCSVPIVGLLVIAVYHPLTHDYCNGFANSACLADYLAGKPNSKEPWNGS